jgi:8-oxo-dGTP pyrophosphatase MutT (NUDIX family)
VVRRATRLIVKTNERIFLEHDSDPGAHATWWMTPGGGVDGDETFAAAGIRELFEETGWVIQPDDLIGPVAHRVVTHGYSDEVLVQEEQFFVVNFDAPRKIDTSGFTAEEQVTMLGAAWFTTDELANINVYPPDIFRFLTTNETPFIEYGLIDESIVSLDERFVPGFVEQLLAKL